MSTLANTKAIVNFGLSFNYMGKSPVSYEPGHRFIVSALF